MLFPASCSASSSTGVVAVLMTFVAIATVDHWGRRGLMLSGAFGLTLI